MLDSDIAGLFEVETKYLNKQMKRNLERFPEDFCFQLNSKEFKNLRFQNVTFNLSTSGRKYLPYVYTEHGVIALSNIMNSDHTIEMSIKIVRTFIHMRKPITDKSNALLQLYQLQKRQISFEPKTDERFKEIIKMITELNLLEQI